MKRVTWSNVLIRVVSRCVWHFGTGSWLLEFRNQLAIIYELGPTVEKRERKRMIGELFWLVCKLELLEQSAASNLIDAKRDGLFKGPL